MSSFGPNGWTKRHGNAGRRRMDEEKRRLVQEALRDGGTHRQIAMAYAVSKESITKIRREIFEGKSKRTRRELAPELLVPASTLPRRQTKPDLGPSCIRPIPLARLMAGRA